MSRTPDRVSPPVIVTIAGSDSGGGAGIQADLKTIEASGGFGTSVVTAVTAQHTRGVEQTHVLPVEDVRAQAQAVFDDFAVDAVKTGMLATRPIVELATERARDTQAPVVVDPVIVAASGDRLLDRSAEQAYESLIETATVVTPNRPEAEVLTGVSVTDTESARRAGTALLETGADAAVIKGGHTADTNEAVTDVLVTDQSVTEFRHPRVSVEGPHGTGCALASAIATKLADGADTETAVGDAVDLLGRAIRYPLAVGAGADVVHHLVGLRNQAEHEPTAAAVRAVRDRIQDSGEQIARLVPAAGTAVVGATPYAERPAECAVLDGRPVQTNPDHGQSQRIEWETVRFGGSSYAAEFLLAVREVDTPVRFVATCRVDGAIERGLDGLDWTVGEIDRQDQPRARETRETIRRTWQAVDGRPAVVIDRGPVETEPTTWVLGDTADELIDRLKTLAGTVDG